MKTNLNYTSGEAVQDGSLIIGGLTKKEHDEYTGTGGLVICDVKPNTEYTTAPEEHTQGNAQIILEAFKILAALHISPKQLYDICMELAQASGSLLSIIKTIQMEGYLPMMDAETRNLLSAYKLQTEKTLAKLPNQAKPVGSKHLTTLLVNERQMWFLRCAVEAKDAILPLHPNTLDADIFEDDYGVSKEEVNAEIADLKTQLI